MVMNMFYSLVNVYTTTENQHFQYSLMGLGPRNLQHLKGCAPSPCSQLSLSSIEAKAMGRKKGGPNETQMLICTSYLSGKVSTSLQNLEIHHLAIHHPQMLLCMVYLPTKLGHFWSFYVGKYVNIPVQWSIWGKLKQTRDPSCLSEPSMTYLPSGND